jgi:hypothetical protein
MNLLENYVIKNCEQDEYAYNGCTVHNPTQRAILTEGWPPPQTEVHCAQPNSN